MKSDDTTKSAGYCSVLGFNLRQLTRYVAGEIRLKSEKMTLDAANVGQVELKMATQR